METKGYKKMLSCDNSFVYRIKKGTNIIFEEAAWYEPGPFFMLESIRFGKEKRKKEEVVTHARVRWGRIINLTVFSLCPLLFYV